MAIMAIMRSTSTAWIWISWTELPPAIPPGRRIFQITQSPMDPTKDYYNTIVDPEEQGGNPDSYYFADDRNTGKTTANGEQYEADAVERIYHYGSISEDKQVYNNVSYPTEKGEEYQDNITVMEGMQIAYDGKYAPMLVPWTVTEPVDELVDMAQKPDGSSSYKGYAYHKYRNTYYTSKLRIEKLDAETGENILHDGAFFALYAAEREDGQDTDGLIKFYEQETLIKGSKRVFRGHGGYTDHAGRQGSSGYRWIMDGICASRYTDLQRGGTNYPNRSIGPAYRAV